MLLSFDTNQYGLENRRVFATSTPSPTVNQTATLSKPIVVIVCMVERRRQDRLIQANEMLADEEKIKLKCQQAFRMADFVAMKQPWYRTEGGLTHAIR